MSCLIYKIKNSIVNIYLEKNICIYYLKSRLRRNQTAVKCAIERKNVAEILLNVVFCVNSKYLCIDINNCAMRNICRNII